MPRLIKITPVAAPRQVRSDKWNPSPAVRRYRAYKDELRLNRIIVPENYYHLVFILPMPRSWSKRKKVKYWAMPHHTKPDRDNLEKAFLDAIFDDDSHIWDGRVSKVWGYEGYILLSDTEIDLGIDLRELLEVDRR